MKYLDQFSIPLKGLKLGIHKYSFVIESDFFKHMGSSLISEGKYNVEVICDNRSSMFVLDFNIYGTYSAECDRCLVKIDVPSKIDYSIIVKISTSLIEKENGFWNLEEDIVYIDDKENKLNLSQILYQLIVLSMPLSNVYDCENDPNPKCDFNLLSKMGNRIDSNSKNEISTENPIWAEIKNIIKN